MCGQFLSLVVEFAANEADHGRRMETEGAAGGEENLTLQGKLILLRPPMVVVRQRIQVTQHRLQQAAT